jgi:hypothetical protein
VVARVAIFLSLVAFLSGCSTGIPLLKSPQREKPIRVSFVSGATDDAGKWQMSRNTDVPFRPGRSGYGWTTEMPSSKEVVVTETIALPKPGPVWPKNMVVTDNGRVGTATRRLVPKENKAYGFWTIAEGDPTGDYELTVSINDDVYRFRFRVTPEAPVTERQILENISRLVTTKREAEGLSAACTRKTWGWDSNEYDNLGPAEVRSRVDFFAAKHANRAEALRTCQKKLLASIADLNTLADSQIALIARVPSLAGRSEEWKQFLEVSIGRLRARTTKLLPLAIDLEERHAAYFREVRKQGKGGPLVQPAQLQTLEYEIFRAARADAGYAIQEAEILNSLVPSPKTRARLELLRIHEALYRALDKFQASDNRSEVAKLQAVRRDLRGLTLMILQAADNKEIGADFPGVIDQYREVFKSIEVADKYLAAFETVAQDPGVYSRLSAQESAEFTRTVSAATAQLIEIIDQAEARLIAADDMLR